MNEQKKMFNKVHRKYQKHCDFTKRTMYNKALSGFILLDCNRTVVQ